MFSISLSYITLFYPLTSPLLRLANLICNLFSSELSLRYYYTVVLDFFYHDVSTSVPFGLCVVLGNLAGMLNEPLIWPTRMYLISLPVTSGILLRFKNLLVSVLSYDAHLGHLCLRYHYSFTEWYLIYGIYNHEFFLFCLILQALSLSTPVLLVKFQKYLCDSFFLKWKLFDVSLCINMILCFLLVTYCHWIFINSSSFFYADSFI